MVLVDSSSNIPTGLPVASACLRNQQAILDVIQHVFSGVTQVLELGSGTGQHATHFAAGLPHLRWQPTELEDKINGITLWRGYAGLNNIEPPLIVDVSDRPWTTVNTQYDAVFTANTLHFVAWSIVESLFAGLSEVSTEQSVLAIYGPFNRNGQYTSEGNRALDSWLKQRDADSGIKDLGDIEALALQHHWKLRTIYQMPANNLLLELWKDSG